MRTALLLGAALLLAVPSRGVAQISPGPLARVHHGLEGPTNCAQCHGLHREPMSQMCLACHKDVAWLIAQNRGLHAREVKVGKKECQSCHPDHAGVTFALIAWPEGSASRFDHRRADWALEGRHAETKCEDCHTMKFRVGQAATLSKRRDSAGWLGLETSCVSCHRSDDVHQGSLTTRCESCHDARDWKKAPTFDHARSDYPLTGRHADVACDKCHLAPRLGIRPNADGKLIPLFKPLPFRSCANCHTDPHTGRLTGRCDECHTTRGWQAIDKREFDHALTRYPLQGKHRTVACESCHGRNLAVKDPPYAGCASCHADAHRGEATLAGKPADCAACHRVEGFTPSTFTVAQHASTRYPLNGKHAAVKCAACHTAVTIASAATRSRTAVASAGGAAPTAGGGLVAPAAKIIRIRLPFAHCAECHQDQHGGQLASKPGTGTCEACHSDAGWTPSTFSLAAHAKLRLPLDGRHAKIACGACHADTRAGLPKLPKTGDALGKAHVMLDLPEVECGACHVDPHHGRYVAGGAFPVAGGCATCHNTDAFRPSTVTVALHARFSFPLEGAHRSTPCVACHDELKAAPAAATLLLAAKGVADLPFSHTRATACRSCHRKDDPHGAQFAARKDRGACDDCHGLDAFSPASRFNHDRDAAFPLAGAHAKVRCAECHQTEATSTAARRVVYRPLSTRCESCHAGGTPGRTP